MKLLIGACKMPNHYQVVGLCARDWKAMEASGIEDVDAVDLSPLGDCNLCELVDPLPDDLKNIVAQEPPVRYRHKQTGEWHESQNGPLENRTEYEAVPLSREEMDRLQAEHCAVTWYDWQRYHWGTKWGTYNTSARVLGGDGCPVLITFQCAWGPPNAATMALIADYLRRTYFLTDIKWLGHDPYDGSTQVLPIESESTAT